MCEGHQLTASSARSTPSDGLSVLRSPPAKLITMGGGVSDAGPRCASIRFSESGWGSSPGLVYNASRPQLLKTGIVRRVSAPV